MADKADETKVDSLKNLPAGEKSSEPLVNYDKNSQKILREDTAANSPRGGNLPNTEIVDSVRNIPTAEEYLIDSMLAMPAADGDSSDLGTALYNAVSQDASETAEFIQAKFDKSKDK